MWPLPDLSCLTSCDHLPCLPCSYAYSVPHTKHTSFLPQDLSNTCSCCLRRIFPDPHTPHPSLSTITVSLFYFLYNTFPLKSYLASSLTRLLSISPQDTLNPMRVSIILYYISHNIPSSPGSPYMLHKYLLNETILVSGKKKTQNLFVHELRIPLSRGSH